MKAVLIVLGAVIAAVVTQRRPPNYSADYMPDTTFNCRDKVVGGYYADPETDCQMFHVCVKVPGIGVGVQDYRFLCPNDTTFDQENQICANWYDIDCEASTLFYSDNFDLYRLDKAPKAKVTPLALGPSTPRPRPQPKAVDDEEEFYLQRSETGDRRLQKDLLRGSSSGNFFNKNKGKDDDDFADDDYKPAQKKPVVPRPAQPAAVPGQKKLAVRKQVRKRPQESSQFDTNARQSYGSTTAAAQIVAETTTTTTTERYVNRQNNRQSFRQRVSTSEPVSFATEPTTLRTFQSTYNPSPSTYNPSTFNSNPSTYNPSTFNNNNPSTYNPSTFNSNPSTYNPSTFNNNNPSTYNPSSFNPSTASPARGTQYQPRYNTVNRPAASTTTTSAPVQSNNFQSRNNRPRFDSSRSQPTTKFVEYTTTTAAPSSTTYLTTTFAPVVTYNGNYKGRTAVTPSRSTEYQDYSGSFDSYGNQRDTSDEYVEIVKNDEEFLKTAPSNNIRPSNFNNFGKSSTNFAANNNNNQNNNNKDVSADYSKSTNNYKQITNNYNKPTNNYRDVSTTDFTKAPQNYNRPIPSSAPADFAKAPAQTYRPNQQQSTGQTYQNTNAPQGFNTNSQGPSSTPNYNTPNNNDFTKAQQNYNRPSSTVNYNNQGASTDFTKAPQNFRSANPSTNYQSTDFTRAPQNKGQNSPSSTQYFAPSTTPKSVTEKKAVLESKLSKTKLKDASYDYAYYDDTEYEGADPISDHHFGKAGESQKISG